MAAKVLMCLVYVCLSFINVSCQDKPNTAWVIYKEDDKSFQILTSQPKEFVVKATYVNSINKTGWAQLDINSSPGAGGKYSDSQQSYAAGFIEGYLTRSLIKMHRTNTLSGLCPEPLSKKCVALKTFLEDNLKWVKKHVNFVPSDLSQSPYWYHIGLLLEQIAGLQDGYHGHPGHINTNLDVMDIYLGQVDGDLEDLDQLFQGKLNFPEDPSLRQGPGKCSALLRVLPTDLLVAQDTWNDLPAMLRILKRYNLELHTFEGSGELIPGNTMTFSSYPGTLMSGDDFYSISSGLLTQETTIGNSNPDLLKYITTESVLEGFRSLVSNRLAKSGREWANMFEMYNSGTYNNQWMIVDYKRFVPFQVDSPEGLFYLVEQIPGFVKYADMTSLLYKQKYYGSYNVAYFPEVFNKSGMVPLVQKFGDWFSYDKTPRALIFKRDAVKVYDLDSMTKLMRYNNFRVDPLSRCNCTPPYSAENAIACRDDLNPANGTYALGALGHRPHVATDMKLSSYKMSESLSFLAISGPTYDDLPAFQWSTSDYKHLSHVGHPDLWKFPRILYNGTHQIVQ